MNVAPWDELDGSPVMVKYRAPTLPIIMTRRTLKQDLEFGAFLQKAAFFGDFFGTLVPIWDQVITSRPYWSACMSKCFIIKRVNNTAILYVI